MARHRATFPIFTAAVLAVCIASPAQAHMVSADVGDFYAGLLHPLTSPEHWLPMLALALFAGQVGRAAARAAVLAFPLALAAGVAAGARFPGPSLSFVADAAGLVVLGLGLAAAPRLTGRTVLAVAAAVALGLVLGWRSGGDLAASAAGWRFAPGVAVTGFAVVAVAAAWVPRLAGVLAGGLRLAFGLGLACCGLLLGLGVLESSPFGAAGLPRFPAEADLLALAGSAAGRPGFTLAALGGAFVWGAGHALTPGHGKALAAAYLVGERGTPGRAVALGLVVTLTHTLGVFLLGLAAWLAADSFDRERLFPWLSLVSGLGVATVGAALVAARLRRPVAGRDASEHSHGGIPHSHGGHGQARGGEAGGWRSLVALGVSGGLVPCPGALVLLLGAVAVGRVGFGLALTAAFSLGLAGVLIVVGLLFVKGARLLEASAGFAKASRWLPVCAALAVTVLGLVLTVQAVIALAGA